MRRDDATQSPTSRQSAVEQMTSSPDLDRAAAAIEQFLEALGHSPRHHPRTGGNGATRGRHLPRKNSSMAINSAPPTFCPIHVHQTQSNALVGISHLGTSIVCPHHLLPRPRRWAYCLSTLGPHCGSWRTRQASAVLRAPPGTSRGGRPTCRRRAGRAPRSHRRGLLLLELRHTCAIARGNRQPGMRCHTIAFAGTANDQFRSSFNRFISNSTSRGTP